MARLLAALREATARAAGSDGVSVLYSGGLDSSLIAALVRDRHPTLVAVGLPGAADLRAARTGAAALGLPLTARELTLDDIAGAKARWAPTLVGTDFTGRAVALGIALALTFTETPTVLCGQGADELFLGYAHFRGLDPDDAARRRSADLERLTGTDWPCAQRISTALGRRLGAPFLDAPLREAVLRTEAAAHLPRAGRSKPMLRAIADAAGLPRELVERPKKAFQFGSGIAAALRRLERPATSAPGAIPP